MQFCLRGIEIDVALPRSLEEANRRIDKLASMQQRLQEELKQLPPKSVARKIKGQTIQELTVELQILKRWRRNANIRLEKLLSIACPVDSRELQTEAGLIKHLYLEFRRLNRERVVSIEPESTLSTLLSAAQHWLKNHYSTTLPAAELVKGSMSANSKSDLLIKTGSFNSGNKFAGRNISSSSSSFAAIEKQVSVNHKRKFDGQNRNASANSKSRRCECNANRRKPRRR